MEAAVKVKVGEEARRGHRGEGSAALRRAWQRRCAAEYGHGEESAARRGGAAAVRVKEGTRQAARAARGAGSAASGGGQPAGRRRSQGLWS
jgi:hypothetical protein